MNFTMVEDIFPRGYDKERVANGHLTEQVCQVHLTTIQHSSFQYTGDNLFSLYKLEVAGKKTTTKTYNCAVHQTLISAPFIHISTIYISHRCTVTNI